MSPEDLQKLYILSSSTEEYVSAVSSKLIEEAENNGHHMAKFNIVEGLLCAKNVRYELIQSFCVKCVYEIEIEFGDNETGEFAEVKVSGDEKCVGEDI
jgi:hypothetical protein